jgi:hypothetical protein
MLTRLSLALGFLASFATPAAAQIATPTTDWRVSFIPGVTDASGNLINVTEVRQFAVKDGKLYVATGAWKDAVDPKGQAMVLRLDCSTCQWAMEADLGGPGSTTGALVNLNWKATESGKAVNINTLVASTWASANAFVKNNTGSDGKWYETVLADPGQIRAFATWDDTAANKFWGFAGGKPGIFRGQLSDNRSAGQNIIHWHTGLANMELDTPETMPLCSGGGRVTGFASARGKLFASACWSVYVRHDGDQGDCRPSEVKRGDGCAARWTEFWTDPHAAQGESGLRGLTTVTLDSEQYLLIGSESASLHITRLDPDTAQSVVELDVSDTLESEWGGATGYGIIPYNSPAPLIYGADGRGRRIFGFEVWQPGDPTPGHARKLANVDDGEPQVMNGEGWFFVRNAASSYKLWRIPAITPQPMTAVRDAIQSPFPDECDAAGKNCWVYFGGFDANKSATQTACPAKPCTFPPLVAAPTHNTGFIVKGWPLVPAPQ